MNREGQRSDAHSRISYVAVKQDCNMLNGKQYLQICDINKFEAQTGPHLFSQYSHFTRRGRAWVFICMMWSGRDGGNLGSTTACCCGETCKGVHCHKDNVTPPLRGFWVHVLMHLLSIWFLCFLKFRCKLVFFYFKKKSALDGYISKAAPVLPLRICDLFCYQPGDFQQCGNSLLYQHQSQLWLIVAPFVDFSAGEKEKVVDNRKRELVFYNHLTI